jgi:hypothetical protein
MANGSVRSRRGRRRYASGRRCAQRHELSPVRFGSEEPFRDRPGCAATWASGSSLVSDRARSSARWSASAAYISSRITPRMRSVIAIVRLDAARFAGSRVGAALFGDRIPSPVAAVGKFLRSIARRSRTDLRSSTLLLIARSLRLLVGAACRGVEGGGLANPRWRSRLGN